MDLGAADGAAVAALIEKTLSAASATSAAIIRFIRSVRAAHADLSAVTRELSDLRLLLELLRDEPDIPPRLQADVLGLLSACEGTLGAVDAALARCRDSDSSSAQQWAAGASRDEIARLHGRLSAYREALALVLEVAALCVSPP